MPHQYGAGSLLGLVLGKGHTGKKQTNELADKNGCPTQAVLRHPTNSIQV
jgi:hypothetical protein